jgi:hypothetical protein
MPALSCTACSLGGSLRGRVDVQRLRVEHAREDHNHRQGYYHQLMNAASSATKRWPRWLRRVCVRDDLRPAATDRAGNAATGIGARRSGRHGRRASRRGGLRDWSTSGSVTPEAAGSSPVAPVVRFALERNTECHKMDGLRRATPEPPEAGPIAGQLELSTSCFWASNSASVSAPSLCRALSRSSLASCRSFALPSPTAP